MADRSSYQSNYDSEYNYEPLPINMLMLPTNTLSSNIDPNQYNILMDKPLSGRRFGRKP